MAYAARLVTNPDHQTGQWMGILLNLCMSVALHRVEQADTEAPPGRGDLLRGVIGSVRTHLASLHDDAGSSVVHVDSAQIAEYVDSLPEATRDAVATAILAGPEDALAALHRHIMPGLVTPAARAHLKTITVADIAPKIAGAHDFTQSDDGRWQHPSWTADPHSLAVRYGLASESAATAGPSAGSAYEPAAAPAHSSSDIGIGIAGGSTADAPHLSEAHSQASEDGAGEGPTLVGVKSRSNCCCTALACFFNTITCGLCCSSPAGPEA